MHKSEYCLVAAGDLQRIVPSEKEKDNEIKRLKMENELLQNFLRLAGRK